MKNRIYLVLVLITLFSTKSISQNIHFIKSYGNNGYDYGRDIKQDLDTGYIATGSSSSFTSGTADAFLLKVDSLGNFKWSYNYGGQETDWGESVVVTNDSSYAIGGYTNSFGAGGFDFYLVRADKDGTPLWEKTYGGSDWDRAHSIIQLADSGFVLVGDTYSYGNGNADIYMVRTDKYGDTLWTNTYGGSENDFGNAVILDGDSLIVVGGTESFGNGMSDGIILKYHIDGTFGWRKVVGKERDDYFTSIAQNSNGDYSFGGSRNYYHFEDCDCGNDFWYYRISSSGIKVRDTTRNGANMLGYDLINDLIIDEDNAIIYGGSTTTFGSPDIAQGHPDAYLTKSNSLFYPYWSFMSNFGGGGDDVTNALDNCFDNGYIGIGNLNYNSVGGSNLFIVKVDKHNIDGNLIIQNELTNENITLTINENNNQLDQIIAFPTVTNNFLIIKGVNTLAEYSIYTLNGNLFSSGNINNNEYSINVSLLEKGLYIINIPSKNKSYKFIKK
jgi:hypothetical protein